MPKTTDIPAAESAPSLGSVAPVGALIYENYGLRGVERELVKMIEYHPTEKGVLVPHSVFTTGEVTHGYYSCYDFEWCRRDQECYHHESGGGGHPGFYMSPIHSDYRNPPKAAVWWNRDVTFPYDAGNSEKRLTEDTLREWGYDVLPDPLVLSNGFETSQNPFDIYQAGNCEYCSRCQDFFPWESHCEHIWECEKCGHTSTPGDRCKHRRSSH